MYVRRKDVNRVADKYSADLNKVVDRSSTILAEELADAAVLVKRRELFVTLLQQHETAIQHKVS